MRRGSGEALAVGQPRCRPAASAHGQLSGIPLYSHCRPFAGVPDRLLDLTPAQRFRHQGKPKFETVKAADAPCEGFGN